MLPQQDVYKEYDSEKDGETVQGEEYAPPLITDEPVVIHQNPCRPEYEPECSDHTTPGRPHDQDDDILGFNGD